MFSDYDFGIQPESDADATLLLAIPTISPTNTLLTPMNQLPTPLSVPPTVLILIVMVLMLSLLQWCTWCWLLLMQTRNSIMTDQTSVQGLLQSCSNTL